MKILVTGAAGLIGSNLCRTLLENGYDVFAIDNFITGSRENIAALKPYKNFKFFEADISKSLPQFAGGRSRIDRIYHLACPTGVPNLTKLAFEMLETCSVGTWNVLEVAKKNKAKVLFASSSEVYGDPQVFPQTEDYRGDVDTTGVRSPYEEGKRFSETQVAAYVRNYDLDARIVRIFNTYGPGMSRDDMRVITRFMSWATSNKSLEVQGNGRQKRTFCYVDDLVKGLILAMEKGRVGEVYNLGSDRETSILDLAKMVIDAAGSKSKIKYTARPVHDHQRRKPDLSKVNKLGWMLKTDLKSGIMKTLKDQTR